MRKNQSVPLIEKFFAREFSWVSAKALSWGSVKASGLYARRWLVGWS
jgi:hypothetical protein